MQGSCSRVCFVPLAAFNSAQDLSSRFCWWTLEAVPWADSGRWRDAQYRPWKYSTKSLWILTLQHMGRSKASTMCALPQRQQAFKCPLWLDGCFPKAIRSASQDRARGHLLSSFDFEVTKQSPSAPERIAAGHPKSDHKEVFILCRDVVMWHQELDNPPSIRHEVGWIIAWTLQSRFFHILTWT